MVGKGGLRYCKKWELEDKELSPTEITRRVLHATMDDIEYFLNFTMETANDFPNGWLPTLDTELKVTKKNRVEYRAFEKPVSSNVGVQMLSAMDENSKMKTLANDLTRMLLNTSETLGMEEKVKVVDRYSQKMFNSGFGLEQVRRIVTNGIKGYERRLRENRVGVRRVHRTTEESSGDRGRKKLLERTEWFKKKRRGELSSLRQEGVVISMSLGNQRGKQYAL